MRDSEKENCHLWGSISIPNKQKLSTAEKVDLVRRCQAGKIGVSEGGREAGVAAETVRGWIARYEREGVEGFIPQKKNRVYSSEQKIAAVSDYLSGNGSFLEVCKKTSQARKIFNPVFPRFATKGTDDLSKNLLKALSHQHALTLLPHLRKNIFSETPQKCPEIKEK